jgi:hypothetical protein
MNEKNNEQMNITGRQKSIVPGITDDRVKNIKIYKWVSAAYEVKYIHAGICWGKPRRSERK